MDWVICRDLAVNEELGAVRSSDVHHGVGQGLEQLDWEEGLSLRLGQGWSRGGFRGPQQRPPSACTGRGS